MKVVNREARAKTFSGFLVGVCAVVGRDVDCSCGVGPGAL